MKNRVQTLAEWGLSLGIALIVMGMIMIPMQAQAGHGYTLPAPCAAGCDSGCSLWPQANCILNDNSGCTNDQGIPGVCDRCRCRYNPNILACWCPTG